MWNSSVLWFGFVLNFLRWIHLNLFLPRSPQESGGRVGFHSRFVIRDPPGCVLSTNFPPSDHFKGRKESHHETWNVRFGMQGRRTFFLRFVCTKVLFQLLSLHCSVSAKYMLSNSRSTFLLRRCVKDWHVWNCPDFTINQRAKSFKAVRNFNCIIRLYSFVFEFYFVSATTHGTR